MNAASVARKRRRDIENAKVEADERVLLQHEVENVDAVHAPFEFNAIDENPLPHDGEAVGGGGWAMVGGDYEIESSDDDDESFAWELSSVESG